MLTIDTRSERIVIQARLDELPRLGAWVANTAQRAGIADDTKFAMQLCLEEAAANIIMYGGLSADASITIDVSQMDGAVTAVIEDTAAAFDPTQTPPHLEPSSLRDAKIGGVGVHLMRNYSSAMSYERLSSGNRLTFRFIAKP